MKTLTTTVLALMTSLHNLPVLGIDNDASDVSHIEEVVVIGTRQAEREVPGSGTLLDEEDLDAFDHIDLGQLLGAVPGVYMREEDGYGLRPNIGIRGAAAERSQKITLMEDGVLITPAPYSAPAAYYVPNVSRINAIEVLKGPSAIEHGPHTVGGAINFVTRPIPEERLAEIDISGGSDGFYKLQGAVGGSVGNFGVLFDGLSYGSDGFKDLDGGGDTGFERNDFGVKLSWKPQTERTQILTLKFGYGEEDADETYLGLTDTDFDRKPERRYPASQIAQFESEHTNLLFNYGLEINASLSLNAKAYYNEFQREWNKLDGFVLGPALQSVMARPDQFATAYAILSGTQNSQADDAEALDITNNDRYFESQGIQLTINHEGQIGDVATETRVGIRVHNDQVDRYHQPTSYLMTDGRLIPDGVGRAYKVWNRGESDAVAVFVSEKLSWERLSLNIGVRFENIEGELTDRSTGLTREADQDFVSPGVGLFYKLSDNLGLLAGVYRGFSPSGPGSGVDPEESINYEYGFRYTNDTFHGEVIGFFSDYESLIGRCRVSDSGCVAGEEFNGGEVEIAGVEVTGALEWPITEFVTFRAALTYTYTDSSFESSFLSNFSQWGLVREGDELPYLPEQTGQLDLSLASNRWGLKGTVKFQEQMREEPGSVSVDDGLHADGYVTVDVVASYFHSDRTTIQLIVQNATDEAAIISHRPFGARPNRPRAIIGRLKYRF